MDKREVVLEIIGEIEGWADDNDIATSALDQIELAERIYNLFQRRRGEWRKGGAGSGYETDGKSPS